jgi:hypothetical protein
MAEQKAVLLGNKSLLCPNQIPWLLSLVGGDYFPVCVSIAFLFIGRIN